MIKNMISTPDTSFGYRLIHVFLSNYKSEYRYLDIKRQVLGIKDLEPDIGVFYRLYFLVFHLWRGQETPWKEMADFFDKEQASRLQVNLQGICSIQRIEKRLGRCFLDSISTTNVLEQYLYFLLLIRFATWHFEVLFLPSPYFLEEAHVPTDESCYFYLLSYFGELAAKEKDERSKLPNVEKIISFYSSQETKEILRGFGVKKLILFGSVVDGENMKGSDIDMLISFRSDVDSPQREKAMRWIKESNRSVFFSETDIFDTSSIAKANREPLTQVLLFESKEE